MEPGIYLLSEVYPEIAEEWDDPNNQNGYVVHYHWAPLTDFHALDVGKADQFTREWFESSQRVSNEVILFRDKEYNIGWSWDSGPNSQDPNHEVVNEGKGHQAHTIIIFERRNLQKSTAEPQL